jgi:hypothetical protein
LFIAVQEVITLLCLIWREVPMLVETIRMVSLESVRFMKVSEVRADALGGGVKAAPQLSSTMQTESSFLP